MRSKSVIAAAATSLFFATPSFLQAIIGGE